MPREFSRSERMAEQLRRELAEIVRDEIKDPRLGFVSFTEIRMGRDLSHAVVYSSVLNSESQDEAIAILNRAVGFIRKEIARRISARIVPTLKFVVDDSVMRGVAMDALISKARKHDDKGNDESQDESRSDSDNDNNSSEEDLDK